MRISVWASSLMIGLAGASAASASEVSWQWKPVNQGLPQLLAAGYELVSADTREALNQGDKIASEEIFLLRKGLSIVKCHDVKSYDGTGEKTFNRQHCAELTE